MIYRRLDFTLIKKVNKNKEIIVSNFEVLPALSGLNQMPPVLPSYDCGISESMSHLFFSAYA